jgi:hypothetical protein
MPTRNTNKWSAALLLTLFPACNKDADTDLDDTASGACTALTEGRWDLAGSTFGMSMDAILTLSDDGCAFTFSDWNMSMDVPDGGTAQGDSITLNGSGTREWSNCTGIAEDNASVVGACDDGATFEMNLQ